MGAFDGRTALITGASKGIGLHLARYIAAEGANVVLAARSADLLEQAAEGIRSDLGVTAVPLSADLVSADGVQALIATLEEREIAVDILVNNAGVGTHGRFEQIGPDREDAMLRLNILTLTGLTHACLPGMLSRGWGRILNVASTASFQPTPYMATYGASKAFVRMQSIALREELKGTGIRITCLCPGTTETDFFETAGVSEGLPFTMMNVEKVAKKGVRALVRKKAVVVPGIVNKMLRVASAVVPATLAGLITGLLLRSRK